VLRQAVSKNVDDVAFTSDMIDRISAEYCVNPSRIYATGMSNGAFMSYRLACELSNRIAAIGPVAGVSVADPCLPSRPVPVISFNGTGDLLVWYDGGIYESVPGPLPAGPCATDVHGNCKRYIRRGVQNAKLTGNARGAPRLSCAPSMAGDIPGREAWMFLCWLIPLSL